MKVTLLYGGQSAEHDISILSAFNIIQALIQADYTVQPIYILRDGTWLKAPLLTEALTSEDQLKLVGAQVASWVTEDSSIETQSTGIKVEPCTITDTDTETDEAEGHVVFPVLHGPNGEDGTIQGFLEVLNVPYVGAGVTASAAGMDKMISKQLFDQAGIPQVPYVAFSQLEWSKEQDELIQKCEGNLLYPLFVKPANMGSSVGISRVTDSDELRDAVNAALKYDRRIVVEQGISASECEVAVLGNDDAHASEVGRLLKDAEFYDYDEKYVNNTVQMEIPAELPEAVTDQLKDYATRAYRAIDGCGLSRVDFFVTSNHDIYINEINTMPGFTEFSMYPQLWKATGLNARDLVEELIQLAVRRFESRQNMLSY